LSSKGPLPDVAKHRASHRETYANSERDGTPGPLSDAASQHEEKAFTETLIASDHFGVQDLTELISLGVDAAGRRT
jgi:hypothetical protein